MVRSADEVFQQSENLKKIRDNYEIMQNLPLSFTISYYSVEIYHVYQYVKL